MSGYTPVFRSVFTGTLCGQYPDTAAWLFLLALADKHGTVDMTPQYIASVTGMPVAELMGCIERFMQPDPHSRSAAEEGRRLVLIDPARPWGWRIVNHAHYREKARKQMHNERAVETGANRERMATRRDQTRPDETGGDRLSDADTNTDIRRGEGADAPPARSTRSRRKAETALPENFRLTEKRRQYAESALPGVDAVALFEKFEQQAEAKSWTYADWDKAWQVYCRNCAPNSGHWASGQYPKNGAGAGQWT